VEPAYAWRVLGLPAGSAPDDVRRAFRVAALLLHPDRVQSLPPEVGLEAQRRMAELAEAYRVCSAVARGAPPPPPRARDTGAHAPAGPLRAVGGQAGTLLAQAQQQLTRIAPFDAFRAGRPTVLGQHDNATASRTVVTLLEQIADAWPGTWEGDTARALLVTSAAARNALSVRERAGHLVLVVDADVRGAAWDGLAGREELGVAQVVHDHPTAPEELRVLARDRLAELDDWASLTRDADPDVRRAARAHLLLQTAAALSERLQWLSRRERPAYDADVAAWRAAVAVAVAEPIDPDLRDRLTAAASALDPAAKSAARRA
jgi:hypothetical protein